MAGGFVLELDVQAFFDSMDHGHLREILRLRVRDGVVLRLIGKWLKAWVPDSWFASEVQPRLRSRVFEVRYADDAVLVFASEADARRVLAVLPKRLAKYGLTMKSWSGNWVVKWKTARSRLNAALHRVQCWCKRYRHLPVAIQHAALSRKLRGHYGYFGVKWNYECLHQFYRGVRRLWHKWLSRRSSKRFPWARMNRLLERYPLPMPRIVHRLDIT